MAGGFDDVDSAFPEWTIQGNGATQSVEELLENVWKQNCEIPKWFLRGGFGRVERRMSSIDEEEGA